MKVRFTRDADADLEGLYDYVRTDSPRTAQALLERILSAVERLPEAPRKGRPGKIHGTRELIIGRTSHIAVYTVTVDEILIVRVLHGKRRWPP